LFFKNIDSTNHPSKIDTTTTWNYNLQKRNANERKKGAKKDEESI
jgi:hypothetical protein